MNPGADRLPGEVLKKIFSYLPCKDLVESVQFVCTWWQQVSWEKGLWKHVMYQPDVGNKKIVEMLEKAPHLRILNLKYATVDNNLFQLITDLCPHLEHLYICWDSVYFDVTITRPLSRIKILTLFSNGYSRLDFPYLDSAFPNLESLDITRLRFNRKDLEQYLKKKQDSLHTLSLSCCTEDDSCVLPCLSVCAKLRNLFLWEVCDKVRSWKEVGHLPNISHLTLYYSDMINVNDSSPVFRSFPNVTTLVLDYVANDNIFCTLARNCPQLQKLKISSLGKFRFTEVLTGDTLHALHLERLTHLCIQFSRSLTDKNIEHILRLMPQLIHLDLYKCMYVTTECLKLIFGISKLEVLKFDLLNQPLPADLRASDVKNKNLQLMFYACQDVSYFDALRQQDLRVCLAEDSICWMDRYHYHYHNYHADMTELSWIKHCCLWCTN